MTTIRDIQENFESRISIAYSGRRQRYEPTSHWASNIGHACPFFLWAHWKHWEEWPAPEEYLLGVFAQGRDGEELVQRDLSKAGYRFTHQEQRYSDKELRVSGRIDGMLDDELIRGFVEQEVGRKMPNVWGLPCEIKNVNEYSFGEMSGGFRWMLNSHRSWVRKYPMQTLGYGRLIGEPFVGMIIRNKQSRQTTLLIERVSDYKAEIDRCRKRLQYVNECLDSGRKPKPIEYDHMWCHRCQAWDFCPQSGALRGKGIEILNADMSERVRQYHKAIEAAKPFSYAANKAKKELREMLEQMRRVPTEKGQSVVTGGDGIVVQAKSSKGKQLRVTITVKDLKGEDK